VILYLLDTDICIYLIKKQPPEILERFARHHPGDVAISTISVFELEYGAAKSRFSRKSYRALDKFLAPLEVVDLDRAAAAEAAVIRADLERRGTPIGAYDLLIAGLARSQNMILVTNNTTLLCYWFPKHDSGNQ